MMKMETKSPSSPNNSELSQDWMHLCDERHSPVEIVPREEQKPGDGERAEFLTLKEIRKLMRQKAEDHD